MYLGMALAQPLAGLTRDLSESAAMPIFFGALLMAATVIALGAYRWTERLAAARAAP